MLETNSHTLHIFYKRFGFDFYPYLMLLYLLFLHADHYIIMHDETQTPLNSTKPFASGKHRMLYDLLLVLAQKYHETENWFSVLKIVYTYARKFANSHPSKAFIQEIKLLLITHILHKYQLGNIHVEMLNFASDFDADLREHCDVLLKRFAKPVQLSLAMPYKQYEERDYNVNRSAIFIAQMHTHLMFEIVLSQLEQQRWCWTNCCILKISLDELMPSPPLLSYKFFEKNDSKCSTLNFGLDNFLDLCTNIKRAIGSAEEDDIKINAVYPLSSIANVFEDYGRPRFVAHYNKKRLRFAGISSSLPSNIQTCKFEICRIDALIANLKKICSDRGVSLSTILARFVTKYEYFYNFRDVHCKNFRLDSWKVYVEEHQKIMDKVYKKLEGINEI